MTTKLFDFAKTQTYSIKSLNKEQTTKIQSLLKGAGYEIKVDGIPGPETTKVFGQFKLDNYLEHPTDLGVTTYNELVEESELRQRPTQPSIETQPIEVTTKKPKGVKVAGFPNVRVDTKIAGFFTWGQATHDGKRPVNNAEHAENIRRMALMLNGFRQFLSTNEHSDDIRITSWYRPEPWNSEAGGARNSQHLYGKAVDIVIPGLTGRQVADLAVEFGWKGGIGVYTKFPHLCHLDIGTKRYWGFTPNAKAVR